MKFENIYIGCKNQNERKSVIEVVESKGYKFRNNGIEDEELIVCLYSDGEYQVSTGVQWVTLTYQQFMDKYGMTDLKGKIEEAKNKTHMSLHQLSKAIGFNEHYLSAVVKRNRSESTQKKVIALLDDLIKKSQQELTHDFQGKALNTQVEDAMMIPKTEYSEMYSKNTALCFKVGSLEKELEHKNQVLDKRNDLYANLELQLKDKDEEIKKIEQNYDVLLDSNKNLNEKMLIAEQDSEKWQGDYWAVSRENVELINSKRTIAIYLAVSILIIVVMAAFGVLHFNGVV